MIEVAIPWWDSGDEARRTSWEWIRAGWAKRHPEWRVVTGANEGPFSVPASLNAAIRATTADVVVVTGADAQISGDSLRKAVSVVEQGQAAWAMVADQMVRLGAVATTKALRLPVGSTLPQVGTRRVCQLGWGVLVARRDVLAEIPYDERLQVAWEDSAFGYAAATLHGAPYRLERTAVRLLWHPRVRRHRLEGYEEATVRMSRYKIAHLAGDQAEIRRLIAEGLT